MNIKNPKTEVIYWDECNKNLYRWYAKKACKRAYRKRWLKRRLREDDEEQS